MTPQAQDQAVTQTQKELGQMMMKMRMRQTQKQRWWPSLCLLREKIVLALLNNFFHLNSSPNISQREISERKRRLHVYPEFPGSPWHTTHTVNQSLYCHFNSHSGSSCHQVLAKLQPDPHRVLLMCLLFLVCIGKMNQLEAFSVQME